MTEETLETGELDSQVDKTTENDADNVDTLLAQKKHFREKFEKEKEAREKLENDLKTLKAEAEAKKPTEKETPKNSEYSLQDIRALADVHDDDVPKIEKLAKLEGISIAEAKKSSLGQAILRESKENRESAEATNVGTVKRGVVQETPDAIVENFRQGKEVDPEKLAEARMAMKLKK